jgi:hypothetical protein
MAQIAYKGAQTNIHCTQAACVFATVQTTYLYNKQNNIKLQLSFIINSLLILSSFVHLHKTGYMRSQVILYI